MKRILVLLLLAVSIIAVQSHAQSAETEQATRSHSETANVLARKEALTKSFTLSGSVHIIVNGVYSLNGLNHLGQPRYTHSSGDYDMNYDGNGNWWLNTDKNLSGGPKYYRAAGSADAPPLSGWVDNQGQSTELVLVADPHNAEYQAKKNAPQPTESFVSREGTDDIDPDQIIEVVHVEAEQVMNGNATAMAKSLNELNSTHYIYNLRIGKYRINDSNGGCSFGENPDPRYQVSTNFGFTQTIKRDDISCGWQRLDNDGRYMLTPNGNFALTSAASPYSFTMDIFAWEEDGCGSDDTYNDDCFLNDDDHPTTTSTMVTINPSMMSLGYNYIDIEWSGNGAQYGLTLEWELLPAPKLVTMYADANLSGRTQDFGAGDYNVNSLFSGVGNDNISSMQIAPGYKVITYNNSDYVGFPIEFKGTVNFVGGPNDRISSFQVVPDDNASDNDRTLLIYFNGSGKSLEFQLQRFATQVNADQMIFIKGVGGATQNYVGYNQLNLQHREEEEINQYQGFDAFNPFPTTFRSNAKVFKNDNFGGGTKRYFFGVDMDYDGSVGAGYEDEDSYTAAANVLRVLRRYNLKGYSRIIISGHSRGSAVGISSFLFGMKKAIEGNPQFAEFQGLVNDIFGSATTINVLALDPVAGADTPGLRNDYHMGDGWRAREIYQWLKGRYANINYSEIYANGGRMLESDEILGLGGFFPNNTFDPSPNYLHVEPSNNVQRYWLGYRHSSMVNKEEKWSDIYDAAGIPRPWLHTADMLNAGFYNQALFRNHQHWYTTFRNSDQLAMLQALEWHGCTEASLSNPDSDLEFEYYHGLRHRNFNNSDNSPVNMDEFVGNNNIKFRCSEEAKIPANAGLYEASTTYTDSEGWIHYCSCDGKRLLSLNLGSSGANVPTNGVSFKESNTNYFVPGGAGFIINPNGAVIMGRSWNVNATTQPNSNVGVRYYFRPSDYNNINDNLGTLQNQPPLTAVNDLFFYRATSGNAHANVPDIPTASILRNGLMPSTNTWLLGSTLRGEYYAEFRVDSFAGGGSGGGESCVPTIACPMNISVNSAAGQCSAIVTYATPVGSTPGNCSNVTTIQTAGLPSGSAFPVGTTTNTFLVTAANGRTATCSFTVMVTDNQAPTITCPATQTLTLGANCTAILPDYTSLATTADNCGVQSVTQSPEAGTTVSGAGNMTVTLTVTDVNGLTNTCTFTVTKVDNTPPTITCPATQTLTLGANCSATLPDYMSLATNVGDNCGVQNVTQSPAAGTTVSGAGNMSVTLTVTDINGLTNTCTFTVTKVDNTAPTMACPGTQTLVLGANCAATLPNYTSLATTGDNCGVQNVTQSPEAGTTISGAGNMTVTLTVTDINGLTNTCTFTVTKVDNTPPMVQCFNQTLNFNGEESIFLQSNALASASDNCGVQSIGLSPNNISAAQVGQIVPVTVTATDINGNTSTCTAQVTVSGLPAGWSQQPGGAGCAGNNNTYNPSTGVWTATSTNCFYGPPYTADATSFAQRTLCGDGSITAQVTSISGALGWAGLVMRESNAPGAKKAQLLTNLSSLHRREFRTTTNGAAALQQSASNNRHWLRITRTGNQFTMSVSANGTSWFLIGAQNIVMGNCIQMGLIATNYTANSTVTATFASVSFSGSNSSLGSPLTAHSLTPLHSPLTPDFEVYPNPTGGDLNVDLTQYVGRAVRMEVYSLEGKLLQFREIGDVQTTVENLDLSQYANGMYFVKVSDVTRDGISRERLPAVTKRVVLQRL